MAAALLLDADPLSGCVDVGLDPAITPATCVPWKERSRSSGVAFAPGPANPRATMTFGVVEPG
jgi:hypothetical protein